MTSAAKVDGDGKQSPAVPALPPTHEHQTPLDNGTTVDPADVSSKWLQEAQAAFDKGDVDAFVALFNEDGWWRDMLLIDFDFNSLRTNQIKPYLSHIGKGLPKISKLKLDRPKDATLVPVAPGIEWIQSFLTFETDRCRGNGFLRLRQADGVGKGPWKGYTFMTQIIEVKGHEEFAYDRRPLGAEHGENVGKTNWLDKRKEKGIFEKADPKVLIVGGSQNGLMMAARLGALGIDTIVVDKQARTGDSWRKRYHTLVLHDPVWADHFPYISYPPHWPIYTPKDKLANWFEAYAESMELNVFLSTTISPGATYSEKDGCWTVEVVREDGTKRTMKPRYLVMATGFSGQARLPKFPMDEFQGTVCHSSRHLGGDKWKGKKAVVVGCCNSGHDIAADFYEQGADVTIVQRSHTYVMSSEHGIPGLLNGYYEEHGPPLADADIMLTSLPVDMLNEYHIGATKAIAVKDKDILDRLEARGFKLNRYPGGLFIKYFRDGGGYYIDVGCSALIADGKVKLKQGKEITKLTKNGVMFEDGVELPADIVVCATGYGSMRDTVRTVIGSHVADKLGPVWGCDKQGEIPGAWRLCGQPGFWLQCGNFFQARCFTKLVAMQIQMQEQGLADKNFAGRLDKADPDPRF